MSSFNSNIDKLTDHLFRHEAGKMVSVLTRIFGTENLELAEDVVQDALLGAIQTWRLKGIPDNPSAWLFRSAKNKAIDIIRRNKFSTQFDFSDPKKLLLRSEYTLTSTMEAFWKEEDIQDDLLRMMFACCHDEISEENRITLILKTLCGFSTSEIARAFLTSEETVSKRLHRTKEFFRQKKIKPQFPEPAELQTRTNSVLKAVYLIFNEGYNSTNADELIRKDLLDQAMYLCKLLCKNQYTQLPEVFAAMSLMCFHSSRIDSRISNEGEIILLPLQDRSKWNKKLIEEGNENLNKAAYGDRISPYHIEAAIAYEHCTAESFESTNWQRILLYYDWLVKIQPTPLVMLNRLIIVFKIMGGARALEEIEKSEYRKEWDKYYLFHSLLGEIYSRQNDTEKAKHHLETAMKLTQSKKEKQLLSKKINKI